MTQDRAALVAKLRDEYMLVTRNEAADALEAQAAEIARMRDAIEKAEQQADYGQIDACRRILSDAILAKIKEADHE